MYNNIEKIVKTEEEWKMSLTPEEYEVIRKGATEAPFTGKYDAVFENGVYKCRACGAELFLSDSKYDARCGWPSFDKPMNESNIEYRKDMSGGRERIEIRCAHCGAHLGHVFDDGPKTTGKRFCVNSASLNLEKK
ncbi:MAG: peptide-methionine (R)-S-oxide reductase MsrB [Patescibacteria group bacterium]